MFDRKVRKYGVRLVNNYVDTQWIFFLDMAVFNFYLLLSDVWTCPNTFLLCDCSFKICEKPAKFSKSIHVVIEVSAKYYADIMSSTTTWHSVRVVNEYAGTVSA